jgi:hypothetical protein
MAKEIRELQLENGESIFIEVDIDDTLRLPAFRQGQEIEDLPPGAEPTGVKDNFAWTMLMLRSNIRNISKGIHGAVNDLSPSEWSVEFNIGFKGTATSLVPIPYIASSELEGGVKVSLTWKKKEDKA